MFFIPFTRPRPPIYRYFNSNQHTPRYRYRIRRSYSWNPFRSLYNNAWNRVRDYPDIDGPGFGVGLNEARHWHSRAYGGLVSHMPYCSVVVIADPRSEG